MPANDGPINLRGTFFKDGKGGVRDQAIAAANALSIPVHFVVTDSRELITKVNSGFLKFTGYNEQEMVGRKCNFLQGAGTDPSDIMDLREAVLAKQQRSVVILNYCKDGHPFWNILSIKPLFSTPTSGKKVLSHFLGEIISIPVTESMMHRPRLCLDDALQLIKVCSSIPRVPTNRLLDDQREVVDDVDMLSASTNAGARASKKIVYELVEPKHRKLHYRHKNYGKLLSKYSSDESDGSVSSMEDPLEFRHAKFDFVAETSLPTAMGRFRMRAYRDPSTGEEPMAMIVGDVEDGEDVVCRVHDQCVTSEVFGSLKCDCKEQLEYAMKHIQQVGRGIVLYLPQEGRGIGLANKVAAYAVQETGLDTVDANRHLGLPDDARQYDAVKDMLGDLNVESIKLMTNNPRKIDCLEKLQVKISGREPCIVSPNSEFSLNYVSAKARRMGHMIDLETLQQK